MPGSCMCFQMHVFHSWLSQFRQKGFLYSVKWCCVKLIKYVQICVLAAPKSNWNHLPLQQQYIGPRCREAEEKASFLPSNDFGSCPVCYWVSQGSQEMLVSSITKHYDQGYPQLWRWVFGHCLSPSSTDWDMTVFNWGKVTSEDGRLAVRARQGQRLQFAPSALSWQRWAAKQNLAWRLLPDFLPSCLRFALVRMTDHLRWSVYETPPFVLLSQSKLDPYKEKHKRSGTPIAPGSHVVCPPSWRIT